MDMHAAKVLGTTIPWLRFCQTSFVGPGLTWIYLLKKYLTQDGINFTRINNEINIINQTVVKYEKEKKRLRDQNLLKFAAINEVVQNIEEYLWAENQFEELFAVSGEIEKVKIPRDPNTQ